MKDEIKEILEFKENADYKRLSVDEMAILKDYITNLQEENKRLNEWIDNRNDYIDFLNTQNDRLHNMIVFDKLQRRIDKAIEFIYKYNTYFDDSGRKHEYIPPELLNILKGEDK